MDSWDREQDVFKAGHLSGNGTGLQTQACREIVPVISKRSFPVRGAYLCVRDSLEAPASGSFEWGILTFLICSCKVSFKSLPKRFLSWRWCEALYSCSVSSCPYSRATCPISISVSWFRGVPSAVRATQPFAPSVFPWPHFWGLFSVACDARQLAPQILLPSSSPKDLFYPIASPPPFWSLRHFLLVRKMEINLFRNNNNAKGIKR